MLPSEACYIVLDVETTGLSPQHHRVTELAMVRVEKGKITASFEALINPEQYITPFIAEHTGITNAMVYGKPTFQGVLPEIKRFLASTPDAVIVGHNVSFDHGFLSQSFLRAGDRFEVSAASGPQHLLCTCRLARRLLPKLQKKSLKHVQDHFGIKNKRQHRAMGDVLATQQVLGHFLEMAEELEIDTLEALLHFQHSRAAVMAKKTKKQLSLRELVKSFPERPGVYTMVDRYNAVLYIGKAKSLRDRVGSYFSDSNTRGTKLHQMMRSVKQITYEETGSELSALLLESRKIKELRPRYNSLERRYRTYTFLKLDVQNDFPKLDVVREPMQDGAEYYGPFRSWETVTALTDVLNRSFTLRECGDDLTVRKENKPCFYFDIKRCKAPCAMLESPSGYRQEVERLRRFLAAGEAGVLSLVERMMFEAAEKLDFEEAQFLKTRLLELRRVLGTGDRALASLNASDFVILNQTVNGECEVLFVRFGRLIKQVVLNATHLERSEEWFFKQLRQYYGGVAAIPPTCGKPEIDEMRILSHWAELRRRKGSTIVHLEGNWEESVGRLVRELKSIVVPRIEIAPVAIPVLEVKDTAPTKARRLVRKPMK